MFNLDPAPKVITFDCYGTLAQRREVLLREIATLQAAHGRDEAAAPAILDGFSTLGRRLTADTSPPLQGHLPEGFRRGFPPTPCRSRRG